MRRSLGASLAAIALVMTANAAHAGVDEAKKWIEPLAK